MTISGDGEQTRDFIYVADAVAALLAAMRQARAEPALFNVCTGRETSIRELARTIGELCGTPPRIETKPPRPGDIRRSVGDPRRAKERLGFEAQTTLREGLRRLLQHLHADDPQRQQTGGEV